VETFKDEILCSGGSTEQIELLKLEKSGVRVAEYLVELPSKKLLEKKLHKVIKLERERLSLNFDNVTHK